MSDQFSVTWDELDKNSKSLAMEQYSEAGSAYGGAYKSQGSHSRDFRDIEPNRSVRTGFTRQDFDAFRPGEQVPRRQKRIIKMSMEAYDKVGIIRNVIDLMGDFGSQGINIVHENKSVESFYKQWFKRVEGKERSERFLNLLYRAGNVLPYRSSAKITPAVKKYIKSLGAADIKVQVPKFDERTIPWRYNFLNPVSVDSVNGKMNLMFGRKEFQIKSSSFVDNSRDGTIPSQFLDTLPADIKNKINKGENKIPLDPDRLSVFYYKKDDWLEWANPMIYAILDDIIMLEKMRLADLAALDGAISNTRLWTLGNLEHRILPTKEGINKVRDVLVSNPGGGTRELVWGPELSYTESNSQVYKFLGSEKYDSVLNAIYAGLGVPPTLTGAPGNGGFTNNFISLKTLVERLQYGRELLTRFWEKEIEIVRKSMGFKKPAHVAFDQMSLSDEATEKNLLIQLADRDIISHETILERFKEIPSIEKIRLKREAKDRDKESLPEKASPYHNPQHDNDLEKIALQTNKMTPEDVGLETSIPESDILSMSKPDPPAAGPGVPNKPKVPLKNGRPPLKKDDGPRKKRTETPRSKPGVADIIVWTQDSFDKISEITTAAFLGMKGKANMRKLTKAEVSDLERIKLDVLTNTELMSEVTADAVKSTLASNKRTPAVMAKTLKELQITTSNMSIDEYKKRSIGVFIELVMGDKM